MTRHIREMATSMIKRSGEPLAPVILEQLYSALCNSKRVFNKCNQAEVERLHKIFMGSFTDSELDEISGSPEFITALVIMLKVSLTRYGSSK